MKESIRNRAPLHSGYEIKNFTYQIVNLSIHYEKEKTS